MIEEMQSKSELKRLAFMNPGRLYEENEKLKRQVNAMRVLLDAANEELNELQRGEFICKKCGLRKDSEKITEPEF